MKKISFLMLIALLGIAGMSTSLAAQESPESFLGGYDFKETFLGPYAV